MSDARDRAVALLRLPDEEYARLNAERLQALQDKFRAIFSKPDEIPPPTPVEPAMIVLGAPKSADLGGEAPIPLVLGLRYTGKRAWEVDFEQNALLVAVDLRTGAGYSGWPLLDDKRRPTPTPSATPPAPDEVESESLTTGLKLLDLRKGLEGDWGPGPHAITLTVFDWSSNTVVIDFKKKDHVAAPGAARRPAPAFTRTQAGRGVPAPGEAGAALQVADVDPGDPVFIGGAIDLPVAETVVVPSTEGGSLVAATVVLRRLDGGMAVQADLAIPAQVADGRARAWFEFDARKAIPNEKLSGLYQAYLFTGSRVVGPWPMKVGVR
jgi:hypothetical protein